MCRTAVRSIRRCGRSDAMVVVLCRSGEPHGALPPVWLQRVRTVGHVVHGEIRHRYTG